MAGMTSHYEPTYKDDELRYGIFNGSFADKAHPIYVAYDSAIDQLLVWLIEPGPKVLVSEYYVANDTALLVRDDDQEVVGFAIDQFQERFLSAAPQLAALWHSKKLARNFDSYKRLDYHPAAMGRQSTQMDEERIINYSAYQTKSARELCLA